VNLPGKARVDAIAPLLGTGLDVDNVCVLETGFALLVILLGLPVQGESIVIQRPSPVPLGGIVAFAGSTPPQAGCFAMVKI
jgi:hypothetical protein